MASYTVPPASQSALNGTEKTTTGISELTTGGELVSSTNPLPASLATTIAGEDIPNDRTKISNEVVMSNTNTHNAASVLNGSSGTTTNAVYSAPIDCSNYRKYAAAGWGANGNIELLVQVSYDGGSTWLWHPNGFTSAGQFLVQNGDLLAPLCRLAAINTSGSTQNVTAYLCLSR